MPCLARLVLGLAPVLSSSSQPSCNAGDDRGCLDGAPVDGGGAPEEAEDFDRDGYRVVRGALPPSLTFRARQALQSPGVHHNFDPLFFSDRIPDILSLDPVFAEVLESIPQSVEDQLARTLGPWHVGSFHALVIHPHPAKDHLPEDMVGLHADYPYGHATEMWGGGLKGVPADYPPSLQLLFMLDEFTEHNGATRVLPGSHKGHPLPLANNKSHMESFIAGARIVKGKPGDMLVYMGRGLWHAWAPNRAHAPRTALLCQCLPFFVKPMENHAWTLPLSVTRRFSSRLRSRLGIFPEAFLRHSTFLVRSQRNWWNTVHFLTDALWLGYDDPQTQGRPGTLAALAAPLVLWVVTMGRCLGMKHAVGYTLAVAAGLALGAMVTLERLRM